MTQEEKQMLFDDISRRLSCGVIVHHKKINVDYKVNGLLVNEKSDGKKELLIYVKTLDKGIQLPPTGPGDVLPYLRPMSSMTEEERSELRIIWHEDFAGDSSLSPENLGIASIYPCHPKTTDFYLLHHFDYRGLIEKGLALEAPKDMYKTE